MLVSAYGAYRDSVNDGWSQLRRRRVQVARRSGVPSIGQLPEVAGGVVAAEEISFPGGRSASEAVAVGVTTGVLVFVVTRILDRLIFGGWKSGGKK